MGGGGGAVPGNAAVLSEPVIGAAPTAAGAPTATGAVPCVWSSAITPAVVGRGSWARDCHKWRSGVRVGLSTVAQRFLAGLLHGVDVSQVDLELELTVGRHVAHRSALRFTR